MPDYADFRYQHFHLNYDDSGDNSAASAFAVSMEPLERSGGLQPNEVAELVYIYYEADVAADDFGNVADTAEGGLQFRGVVGVDLDSDRDFIDNTDLVVDNGTKLGGGDGDSPTVRLSTYDRDEVLGMFHAHCNTPFSSDAGGVGGSGGFDQSIVERHYRQLTGRGPVIDSNDQISIVARLIKNQVSADAEATVRGTLIWDVAEMSDAGRRFAVPDGD
jgi:hypothetical protein